MQNPFSFCCEIQFRSYQRVVKYKYSLDPLSPIGSLVEPGGRFNDQLRTFPALYIAEDRPTALQESGLKGAQTSSSVLSNLDLALTKKDSITVVSVEGKLGTVIDLHRPEKLKSFLDIIKNFSIPMHIIKAAKKSGLAPPRIVQRIDSLVNTLLEPEWRTYPNAVQYPC